MHAKAEDILDRTIDQLKSGQDAKRLLLTFGYPDDELEGLLNIASLASNLPKKNIPKPSKQRKFLQAEPVQAVWRQSFALKRLAWASLAIFIMAVLGGSTYYAAAVVKNSLPGEKLFSLKKAAENVGLLLTRDPDKRANYQLGIAKQRLEDAEKVLAYPTQDPKLEAAAMAELSYQTQDALQSLKKTATANLIAKKDPNLFNSLVDITQKQQDLLNTLKPQGPGQKVSESLAAAAEQNKSDIAEIKRLAAAADEQALVNLNPDPNLVMVSGVVGALQNAKITVEKTTFYLTADTVIKKDGKSVGTYALALNSKVSISGTKTNSGNILAAEVLILDEQAPTAVAPAHQADKKVSPPADAANAQAFEAAAQAAKNSNQASAGFIPEDPSPQYAP